jgi:cell division protein FtsN
MARDYAKYKPRPKKRLTETGWHKRLLFSTVIAFIAGILLLGVYSDKNYAPVSSQQTVASWVNQIKSHLSHKKTSAASAIKTSPVQQARQEPEVRFNFYKELPDMQVTLSAIEETSHKGMLTAPQHPQAVIAKTKSMQNKNSIDTSERYILQMGVFKNETAAGQARVSLLLAGFEADIVKSTDEDQSLYRIQTGPYATLAQAKDAQKQLRSKGIVGLVKNPSR